MNFWKLLAVTLALGVPGLAQDNPFAGDAGAIELGRVQFRMSCAGCHGLRATGGRSGPDLTRGSFAAGDTDADLFRVISSGIPGTEMPDFGGRRREDEHWRMVAYVRSLAQPDTAPIRGDARSGEKLFWEKGNCGKCHRVGTRGSALGPDLSRAGRARSMAYLRESIVMPDADVTRGYATITVVTRDGKKISGVERNFDNFSTQFMDLSERFQSFEKENVKSMQREYRSVMPAYGNVFSPAELDDLLAYLAGLGGNQR